MTKGSGAAERAFLEAFARRLDVELARAELVRPEGSMTLLGDDESRGGRSYWRRR